MKKLIVILTVLMLSTCLALASPYVSANPDTNHSKYRVRISSDGVNWGAWAEGQPFENHLYFDMGPIKPGDYSGEAQAYTVYSVIDVSTGAKTTVEAWSPTVPFQCTIPSGLTGIKVIK